MAVHKKLSKSRGIGNVDVELLHQSRRKKSSEKSKARSRTRQRRIAPCIWPDLERCSLEQEYESGRQERFPGIRIFHRRSRRKTADIDKSAVRRKRAGHQPFFARHRNCVTQIALRTLRSIRLRCSPDVNLAWWRVSIAVGHLIIRYLARCSLAARFVSTTMRRHFVFWLAEQALQGRKKTVERSSLSDLISQQQGQARQRYAKFQPATFHEIANITASG
jgi:hypothetical protein